ncbi:MAG: MFS transporter [Pseudomonadales bacterium]
MNRRSGFFNVGVLAISNALAFAAAPMMMLVGSLVGSELAPSKDWATLPIALVVIGTALGIVPATQAMQRLGRKQALWLFMAIGVCSYLLAGQSLAIKSFALFCSCSVLMGFTNAALQQIRFAAMECVALEQAPTAVSVIMCGGIVAAMLGPELGVLGRHLSAVDYQGSFWLVAICTVVAAVLLSLFTPDRQLTSTMKSSSRSVSELLKNPAFCMAVVSAAVGYVVMSFVMTGTPISMHHHHGHSLMDTKWVIQCHIVAMFLPSLISPWLFRLMSIRGMMIIGLVCYGVTVIIGLYDTSVMGFWSQLVLLGIGWNFLFVAGTALLPSTYLEGEQFKAQAFNDSAVFSSQAVAALSAGWAMSATSWETMLLICLIPIGFMIFMLIWSGLSKKSAPMSPSASQSTER